MRFYVEHRPDENSFNYHVNHLPHENGMETLNKYEIEDINTWRRRAN